MKDFALNLGIFFIFFSVFVIIGTSNAVNLTDGLDGLAIMPSVMVDGGLGIIGYIFVTIFSIFITQISGFYFLAATIGLFQGGVQSISRTIFSQLIPVGKSAEFFGFYNLVGKSAVVFGPIMVGWVAYTFDNPDFGLLSLLLLSHFLQHLTL